MNKNISENVKEEVLKTYMYTKRPIKSIAKEYNLLYEDVITILEEYKSIHGKITRSLKKTEDVYGLEEKIYQLKEEGLSYQEIQRRVNIDIKTIREICKRIYDSKGKKVKRGRNKESQQLDKKIDELKVQGLSYRKITKKLEENGVEISRQGAEQRHKRFLKLNEKKLAKAILNLTITRKATMKQIQQIADYYGVDLEKTMNSLEEPTHSLDER